MYALKTIAVAFSMFSAIPMPQFAWDEDSMRHMLVAFPLVGVVVGVLMWSWLQLCSWLALPALLRALGLTSIPLVVTGGIHLDGFCDTWDAISSRSTPERMRQILKDPHIGAFGVMHLCLQLLATFALWAETFGYAAVSTATRTTLQATIDLAPLIACFALSRSLAGLSVAAFPIAEGDGLARSFAEASDRRAVRAGCAAIAAAASVALVMCDYWPLPLAATIAFAWYRLSIVRRFGGLSGDLCGWFVQTSELWMLVALYIVRMVS